MSKPCPVCKGRGRWQEMVERADGTSEIVWKFDETCAGTGVSLDPDDGDDFDIGGSSYDDEF